MFSRTRKRVKVSPKGETKTEQKWRDRQSIESIVNRAMRGDETAFRSPTFDFVDSTSLPETLHEFLNNKIEVDKAFDSLPSDARVRWKTPSEFIHAFEDNDEIPFLERCGILRKREKSTEPVTPTGAAENAAQPANT